MRIRSAIAGILALCAVTVPGGPGVAGALAGSADASSIENVLASIAPEVSVPRERALLDAIERREKELDSREEELLAREARLDSIKKDIEAEINELNELKGRLERLSEEIDTVRDERIKRLVKIYESMSPEEAARRMEKLKEETAVMILASMRPKNAGKILGLVSVAKSVKLSQSLRIKKVD